jgi:membrane associated rhomboid family serine protease
MNEELTGRQSAEPGADSRRVQKRPRPIVTVAVLAVTIIVTGLQFVFPEVLEQFQRREGALAAGQWWRLISPLFVHSEGVPHLFFNLAWIAPLGIFIEHTFGSGKWLVLYFIPGVIGEAIAFAWKPHGGGASLAGVGLLGELCVWLLLRGDKLPWRIRGWGPIGLAAVGVSIAHDVHGPPGLVGACLAAVMLREKITGHPRAA